MKKIVLLITILLITLVLHATEYDILAIYEKVELPSGSKSCDSYGRIDDAKYVLVPIRLDDGKYVVELTKEDTNLYRIVGTDYYVELRYCYEYCYSEEVVMILESSYLTNFGKVVFD